MVNDPPLAAAELEVSSQAMTAPSITATAIAAGSAKRK
jgi:hypothetical protein